MRAIYTLLICAALAACGGGECDPAAVVSPQADTATSTPTPTPAPAPSPTPAPAAPEPIIACPQSSGATCPPSPTPAPVRPIVVDPNPTTPCVRDASIALVYVDPFWVDNCGNKYGAASY